MKEDDDSNFETILISLLRQEEQLAIHAAQGLR